MKRMIGWIFANGTFSVLLYLALFEDMPGARNVVVALTWFATLCSLGMVTAVDIAKKAQRERLLDCSVPMWVDKVYDIAVSCLLLWFGWWWTALAYSLHWMLIEVARVKAREFKESEAKA